MSTAADRVFNIRELATMIAAQSVATNWADLSNDDMRTLQNLSRVNQTMRAQCKRIKLACLPLSDHRRCDDGSRAWNFIKSIESPTPELEARMRNVQQLQITPEESYWNALRPYSFPKLTTLVLDLDCRDEWEYFSEDAISDLLQFGMPSKYFPSTEMLPVVRKLDGSSISSLEIIPSDSEICLGRKEFLTLKKTIKDSCQEVSSLRIVDRNLSGYGEWSAMDTANLLKVLPGIRDLDISTGSYMDAGERLMMTMCNMGNIESLKLHVSEVIDESCDTPMFEPESINLRFISRGLHMNIRRLELHAGVPDACCLLLMPKLEECKLRLHVYSLDYQDVGHRDCSFVRMMGEHPALKVLDASCHVKDNVAYDWGHRPITRETLVDHIGAKYPLLQVLKVSVSYEVPTNRVSQINIGDYGLEDMARSLPDLTELVLDCGINTERISEVGLQDMFKFSPKLKYACVNVSEDERKTSYGFASVCLKESPLVDGNPEWEYDRPYYYDSDSEEDYSEDEEDEDEDGGNSENAEDEKGGGQDGEEVNNVNDGGEQEEENSNDDDGEAGKDD